eukprot:TRINITY_DN3699_c0_g1_i6.p1 TRINITY_DN3699_c0_g1~~TRINITY_DN3699_c0_g1_i6.p1  ORF type:complete len:389 (+),score=52.71 TRINITY_DN3699_c0_g1_i6:49-1167(+)
MVVVLAAAELFGSKLNRELEFAQLPSLGELKARAVGVFNDEISARKRPGMPAGGFNLHYIQLFDPVNGRWTELKSPSQLSDYCQIYLFQKDSWNKESQGPIPSPTRPSPVPPPYASRPIARTSSPMRKQQGTPQRRIGSPLRKPVTRGASPAITNTASPKREPISMTRSASPARSLATPRKHSSPAVSRLSPAHTLAVIRAPSTATRKSISPARMSSMSPTGPVAVPYNEKLTMLYTHMLGEKPQVGDEAFRQLFIKTRINIEPLMITKLFQQADANQVLGVPKKQGESALALNPVLQTQFKRILFTKKLKKNITRVELTAKHVPWPEIRWTGKSDQIFSGRPNFFLSNLFPGQTFFCFWSFDIFLTGSAQD